MSPEDDDEQDAGHPYSREREAASTVCPVCEAHPWSRPSGAAAPAE